MPRGSAVPRRKPAKQAPSTQQAASQPQPAVPAVKTPEPLLIIELRREIPRLQVKACFRDVGAECQEYLRRIDWEVEHLQLRMLDLPENIAEVERPEWLTYAKSIHMTSMAGERRAGPARARGRWEGGLSGSEQRYRQEQQFLRQLRKDLAALSPEDEARCHVLAKESQASQLAKLRAEQQAIPGWTAEFERWRGELTTLCSTNSRAQQQSQPAQLPQQPESPVEAAPGSSPPSDPPAALVEQPALGEGPIPAEQFRHYKGKGVLYPGITFRSLTVRQDAILDCLVQHYKSGAPDVHQAVILDESGSKEGNKRLRNAWGKTNLDVFRRLIIHDQDSTKGSFRLNLSGEIPTISTA